MPSEVKREFNKVCFAGRVPQDPDIKYFESGACIANFAISLSQGKNEDGSYKPSIWMDCKTSKANAEWVANNVRKSVRVYIIGKMARDEWMKDGEKRGKNYIWVFEIGIDGEGQPAAPANGYEDYPEF
jgi:single-strand DNA-binding protein